MRQLWAELTAGQTVFKKELKRLGRQHTSYTPTAHSVHTNVKGSCTVVPFSLYSLLNYLFLCAFLLYLYVGPC